MKLLQKTILIGIIAGLTLAILVSVIARTILGNSYQALDDQNLRRNVSRAVDALNADLDNLKGSTIDYAVWDDAYSYVQGEYPEFPADNIPDEVISNLRLNLVAIRDCAGDFLYEKGISLPGTQDNSIPESVLQTLKDTNVFSCETPVSKIQPGILFADNAPLLIAYYPILKNGGIGPAGGILFYGRNLDDGLIHRLSDITHLNLSIQAQMPENVSFENNIGVQIVDKQTMIGYRLIQDLIGSQTQVLKVQESREIYLQGQKTINFFQYTMIGSEILFLILILIPLFYFMLSGIVKLNSSIQKISLQGKLDQRVAVTGNDEISSVANAINIMLANLEENQKILQEKNLERESIFHVIPDMMFLLDESGIVKDYKSDTDTFLGRPVSEISGKILLSDLLSKEQNKVLDASIAQSHKTGKVQVIEFSFTQPEFLVYEFRIIAMGENNSLLIIRDITKRKRNEDTILKQNDQLIKIAEALRVSDERYQLATAGANDGLWDWDLQTNLIYFSPRWKSMLDFNEDEIGDNPEGWFSLIHPDDRERVLLSLCNHLHGQAFNFESEHRIRNKFGEYLWVLSRGMMVSAEEPVPYTENSDNSIESFYGKQIRIAGSQTDISMRKQAEKQLLHGALHDALTGLPNRALFLDRLRHCIEQCKRSSIYDFSVLFLDLDRFKVINDSLGHKFGDDLLIEVSLTLKTLLRKVDTVARLGGDEFVILLETLPDEGEVKDIAERILDNMKHPFKLDGHEVSISASIGIVLGSERYQDPANVLRDADIAMYRAKALGKARYEIFNSSLGSKVMAKLELESALRLALENSEFYLNYQPIYSLTSNVIIGFEALLRWNSPIVGEVSPSQFIPIAEETGLIIPIGDIVLREACRQTCIWQKEFPSDPPLTINVNVSGIQLTNPHFTEWIEQIINETGISPFSLKLEITESVFMDSAEYANEILEKLRKLGVQIQIDDFGTGYSSLAYLQNYPIHTIKIDRSFIAKIGNRDKDGKKGNSGEIVRTIVALANDLGMDAVAEGIETNEQMSELKALNCQYGQGYLMAVPMDKKSITQLLTQRK